MSILLDFCFSMIRCGVCSTESNHENFFTDLHLAFPQEITQTNLLAENQGLRMEDLLQHYFTPEKLGDKLLSSRNSNLY